MAKITNEQHNALTDFFSRWADALLASDIATKLACSEAGTLADLLRAFGYARAANEWIKRHAEADDDPEDTHYDLWLQQQDNDDA